jgi:uncharacterized protein (DUF362 family)
MEDKKNSISRRKFIRRVIKAGASIAAAGALGTVLYDPIGPSGREHEAHVNLPDFSIPGITEKIAIISGNNRKKTVRIAIKAIGGIEKFIKKGDCVVLKVNAAFASPPILSSTTHPDLVYELTKICLEAGASEVRITDNPINDPASCFKLSGIEKAAEKAGGKMYFPKESFFSPFSLKGGKLIKDWPLLYHPLKGATKLIGISPLKDHHRSGASMTMKNWYGLLGGRRNIFHQDIHNIIKELAMMISPTFVILDGTTTMMTNGPTGGAISDLKTTHIMIASTDQVAADAFGATLLERNFRDLPYIEKASNVGIGTNDYESLKPERLSLV